MIYPSGRLIVLASVAAVLAGLAAPGPLELAAFRLLPLALVLAALADAFFSRKRAAAVTVEALQARLVRDKPGILELAARADFPREIPLLLTLSVEPSLRAEQGSKEVRLGAGSSRARLAFECRPSERGVFAPGTATVEAPSGLGLWTLACHRVLGGELRVQANLDSERRRVPALFLPRGAVGMRLQRQIGQGREFEMLRDYTAGDPYEDVHWKASAKRLRPVTKLYQVEKSQEVYVVLDCSRLTARALDGREPTLERFVSAAHLLQAAADRQGDRFGLVVFSDGIEHFLPSGRGPGHGLLCRKILEEVHVREGSPDYDELFTFLKGRFRRRALLIFLTALDDPMLSEGFVRAATLAGRQHLILALAIHDPGDQPLFGEAAPAAEEDLYAQLAGHLRWRSQVELEKSFARRGMTLLRVPSEGLCAEAVSRYLNLRRSQRL